jgi:hypothetical protein
MAENHEELKGSITMNRLRTAHSLLGIMKAVVWLAPQM